jgi:hypothetical protein
MLKLQVCKALNNKKRKLKKKLLEKSGSFCLKAIVPPLNQGISSIAVIVLIKNSFQFLLFKLLQNKLMIER